MTAPLPDQLLEEEIRAMLQRRALDVDPQPPPWRELAQRNGAVVISLRTGAPVDTAAGRRRRPNRQWFRGVLAAAVALIVAMVGALLVQGGGPNHGDSADGPEPLDVPSAGQIDFDAARATPLFPVTDDASSDIAQYAFLSDPTETAKQYLATVGLPVADGSVVVDDAIRESRAIEEGELPVKTATVAWSLHAAATPENPPLSQGGVFLRNPERGARDTWLVVGVFTKTIWITDIRRDGDLLSFTVDRTTETETFANDPAVVSVDGKQIAEVGYRDARPITVTSPASQVAIIQVQIVEDRLPVSVTATAAPAVPGAPVEPLDSVPVPPTTEVAKRANAIAAQIEELADRIAVIRAGSAAVPRAPGAVVAVPADSADPEEPTPAERETVSQR